MQQVVVAEAPRKQQLPQRLHAAPATNTPCLAHREQASKQASKEACKPARKQSRMRMGESEWGGMVLVARGLGMVLI